MIEYNLQKISNAQIVKIDGKQVNIKCKILDKSHSVILVIDEFLEHVNIELFDSSTDKYYFLKNDSSSVSYNHISPYFATEFVYEFSYAFVYNYQNEDINYNNPIPNDTVTVKISNEIQFLNDKILFVGDFEKNEKINIFSSDDYQINFLQKKEQKKQKRTIDQIYIKRQEIAFELVSYIEIQKKNISYDDIILITKSLHEFMFIFGREYICFSSITFANGYIMTPKNIIEEKIDNLNYYDFNTYIPEDKFQALNRYLNNKIKKEKNIYLQQLLDIECISLKALLHDEVLLLEYEYLLNFEFIIKYIQDNTELFLQKIDTVCTQDVEKKNFLTEIEKEIQHTKKNFTLHTPKNNRDFLVLALICYYFEFFSHSSNNDYYVQSYSDSKNFCSIIKHLIDKRNIHAHYNFAKYTQLGESVLAADMLLREIAVLIIFKECGIQLRNIEFIKYRKLDLNTNTFEQNADTLSPLHEALKLWATKTKDLL